VLLAAATSLQLLGRYDEAAEMCEQAIAEIDVTGDLTGRALARAQLARLVWLRDDEDRAHALYSEAAALVAGEPPSSGKAKVIAAHAQSLMLSDHYQEAIPRSREAVELAVVAGDRATQAAATITLGAAIASAGGLDEGAELMIQGLAIAREIEDLDQIDRPHTTCRGRLPNSGDPNRRSTCSEKASRPPQNGDGSTPSPASASVSRSSSLGPADSTTPTPRYRTSTPLRRAPI
jgi:tetratricopeptide (TPR) repeat protein